MQLHRGEVFEAGIGSQTGLFSGLTDDLIGLQVEGARISDREPGWGQFAVAQRRQSDLRIHVGLGRVGGLEHVGRREKAGRLEGGRSRLHHAVDGVVLAAERILEAGSCHSE